VTAQKGLMDFTRDCVAENGRLGMDLFWPLTLPNGIKCTLVDALEQ